MAEVNFILKILFLNAVGCAAFSPYSSQARIYSEDGHLFIVGGTHSNISLKTTGNGFININNQDLLHITDLAVKSSVFVQNFKQFTWPDIESSQSRQHNQLEHRLRRLEASISSTNASRIGGNTLDARRLRLLTRRVNILYRTTQTIRRLLLQDECVSGPCQNGGTCQDLFNGFHCQCTPQWEGDLCERDVDECSRFAGTGLGCQNGATCRNLAGSYACTCPIGWFGLHCNQRTYDCSRQSSADLCGHGVCINQGGTGRGFICMCDQGWKKRDSDGSCTIDVNECAGPNHPCSHDPPVACLNTEGSFQCAPCPAGYSGNGFQCADIDECQNNNGGCSNNPKVQCINTRGSRVCGPCPPGYSGDGTVCVPAGGRCLVNNGGCHQKAVCIDNPALSYVQCQCPAGYVGTGVGSNGCVPGSPSSADISICNKNPCRNGGTCIPLSARNYKCLCLGYFTGPNCSSINMDPCSSSPCKNGGTCTLRHFLGVPTFICQCRSGYSGPTCAQHHEGCVGRFFQNNGTLSYPPKNQTISMRRYTEVRCGWTLYSMNPTRVINVTFTEMNLGFLSRTPCLSNYVEIYDGETSSAPLMGQFCGRQLPPPIASSHPVLFITARILSRSAHFSFNWTAVPRKCGGSLNASTHGTLSSPGSPGKYPNQLHCLWKLIAPYGKRIRFTFFSLDIENHRTCNFDYLEFHNGDSDKGPLLRKFCNSVLPEPFITSGNEAVILFHTDSSRSAKGFQLSYSPVEGLPGCGGTYTAPHETISAPSKAGVTGEYLDDLNCEWLISIPQGERIRINVESLNLESSVVCNYDYLAIYDGPTRKSGLVGRWCGKSIVPPFISTSNEVLVVFESDSTYNEGGFILKYRSVCGGMWSAPSGIIHSPYYPFHYPEDRSCTYTIRRPLGNAIKLNFLDFDLEEEDDAVCAYDFLAIYNGQDETAPLLGKYCGNNKPGLIVSTHNFLHMVFNTDFSINGRGFKANYTTIDVHCGGILTDKAGLINSPKYPEQYPLNQDCTWLISAPVGTIIQLSWLAFNLEKSFSCRRDWLVVKDLNPILAYSGQLGDRYCGNVLPPAMTSSANVLSITLHTDRSVSAPGFSASYRAIDNREVCSGNYMTVMGEIRSPNFPNGYPDNLVCRWSITVPTGQQIELSIDPFNLEGMVGSACSHDYLEIRNGGYDNSPLINRYCGSKVDNKIISMANQLHIKFVSDSSVSAPGFKLIWNGAIMGCGGLLTSSFGSIISPNYPQPYGKNGECFYKITVSQGSVIQMIIVDLDLEEHSNCALDYVEILDGGNKNSPKLAKLCSQNHPPSITSKGNLMYILFRSDTSRQGRGFHFKYTTVCNVTLKGFSGIVESPEFPDREVLPRECFWKIIAPLGNKINITFSHYQFGGLNTPCDLAYLKISEGSSDSTEPNHVLGQFCNATVKPFHIASSTNVVYVSYKISNSNRFGSMFRFEWIVSGCGGIFKRQKTGELSSPGYPNGYPENVVCEWYLSVAYGSSISITIDDFQLERSDSCTFDSLQIYGGSDDTAPRLASICKGLGSDNNIVITTSGNNAFIRFTADSSFKGKGFHATYKELPDSKCGGKFVSESGLIHSHNYPQNYDPHDDCVYLIMVDNHHRINLTFTDFDINAADGNCTNGYVKVYDGESQNDPLLKTLCQNALPPPILSTGNKMFIRYKSDGFATAKGFSALYSPECGANLMTNDTGILSFSESNTTLQNWSADSECKWIIRTSKPNAKFTVQFVLLDVTLFFSRDTIVFSRFDRRGNVSNILVRPGVNIFAGEGTDAPFYGHYANAKIPPAFTIPSSVFTVVYRATDGNLGRFVMDYTVRDTSCGGTLMGEGGTFISPKYPNPYPNNVECVWVLHAAPGNRLLFEFSKFDLQQSPSCNDDYVEVRHTSESGSLIGAYCGNTLPRRIQSNGTLWIKFRSGPEGTAGGFIASYSLALESEVEGFAGKIGSPFYPVPFYSSNSYSWRISVRPGHVIRIAFSDFYIESFADEACFSKLTFYDGFDNTAPLLKELCGSSLPEPFSSGSNVIYISLLQGMGFHCHFLLDWMQLEKVSSEKTFISDEKDCKTFVELGEGNSSYTFTSPGYPFGYDTNLNCQWIFQAPFGDHVRLTFNEIDLEVNDICSADSIAVYHGGGAKESAEEWIEADRFCEKNETYKIHEGTKLVKVVFTSDSTLNYTGFKGKAETVCGGEVIGPNGVISEGPWTTCQWNITVRPSRTIKVTFTKFELTGSPPCTSGSYIMFRDGGRPDSPLLGAGKYCGNSAKDINIPETVSNRLYIYYKNRDSEGITMKFEEKSISCGGDIMLSKSWPSETISSPNYPNIPPPHTECIWRAYVPSGESIHFEVTDRFDMTPSRGCTKEYLELRDGSTESSQLIGRYCSTTPSYVTTEGNSLFVKYFTDTNDPKDGFRGTISMSKCGGSIYDTNAGSIVSPGYPQGYESNLNCTWRLITSESRRFSLNVTVSMGRGSLLSCSNTDRVKISEVMKGNITIIGPETLSICGSTTMLIRSETNEILINFVSYKQPIRTNRFFIVNYRTKYQSCGGNLNLPSGIIKSPGYPSTIVGYCIWKITVPEGRRITLTLIDFDFENYRLNYTSPQRLALYNDLRFLNEFATLVGNMPEKKVYESSGNTMSLIYSARRGSSHRGFIANYTSDQPAICGGRMEASKGGSISMATKPEDAYSCEWKYISNSPLAQSTITFIFNGVANAHSTERSRTCYYVYSHISIYGGNKLYGVYCSETKPNEPYIVSKVNDFSTFKMVKQPMKTADKNVSFTLTWKVDMCGQSLKYVAEAIVRSPGNSTYPPNTDCVWSISVPQGSVIKIHFDYFDLETDCKHDYLKIYNGNSPLTPLISSHCGNIIPADIITQSNDVWIWFHSDESNQKRGFQLKISQVDSGCGGHLHGMRGLVQSIGYPSNYKNNLECEWEIRVDVGFHIGLVFDGRFFIEDSPGCKNDYLEVFDYINEQWKSLGKSCGREIPKTFNSTSIKMRVVFKTNSDVTGDGFKAFWERNCGGVIDVKGPGHIYSPGWPLGYLGSLNCNYTLRAPKKVISARFEAFSLEEASPQGCRYDKVQIWTRPQYLEDLKIVGTYCDTNKPPDLSSIDVMIIHFTTDAWIGGTGFSIAYDIGTCGGDIREETVISSPRNNAEGFETSCVWNITAPPDRVVILKIEQLGLSFHSRCIGDKLELWEPSQRPDSNATLLARLCGKANALPAFRSSGNRMNVIFNSYDMPISQGFSGLVSFSYGEKVGCGGRYILSGGKSDNEKIITNPDMNNDGKYEKDMDCHWVVSATTDSTLIVNFEKMDLKPCEGNSSKRRCCDALEVYDGPSERYELIGRFCGTLIPRSLTSSSNYLALRFVSDGIDQSTGFKATVSTHRSPCGTSVLLVNETAAFLTSPDYPSSYPINVHCRWVLVGEKWKNIHVHFMELDLEESDDCSNDRIEILDEYNQVWKPIAGNNDTHRLIFSGRYGRYTSETAIEPDKNIYCGKGQPLDFYSFRNRVTIRFISDSKTTSKGFKLQYSYPTCNRNYTTPSGRILLDSVKRNCTITISAAQNKTISLYFFTMAIPRGIETQECKNKLEIFDGTNKLNEMCGWIAPSPIFSKTNFVTLRLTTEPNSWTAIDMTYATTDQGPGCGGKFFNTDGGFSSPMYPGNYRNLSYCCWEVTVPLPGVPSMDFYAFDVGPKSTCSSDYVQLFDVSNDGEKILRTTYCGGDKPATFQASSQTAAVCYRTSVHNGGLGWALRWRTVLNVEGGAVAAVAENKS